jgi:hypothetical protein
MRHHSPDTPSSGAARMQRYRQRCKQGAVAVSLIIDDLMVQAMPAISPIRAGIMETRQGACTAGRIRVRTRKQTHRDPQSKRLPLP